MRFSAQQNATREERRAGYTRIFKLGLVRYVAGTGVADQILTYNPVESSGTPVTPETDPWNLWSFRLRGGGSVNGEKSSESHSFNTAFAANRTTDEWKLNSGVNLNFRENSYTLSDGSTFVDNSHEHNASVLLVKSLGDHWATAVRTRWSSNTFLNERRAVRGGAGIEYQRLPGYRRVCQEGVDRPVDARHPPVRLRRPDDLRQDQRDRVRPVLHQPVQLPPALGFGRRVVRVTVYLHDPGRHRLAVDGGLDVRLFKGFSLNLDGSASRIRDQLYLPAGDATDEEILLRRRQLATGYRYQFSVGFSYTFGSIFNNIVNTRF